MIMKYCECGCGETIIPKKRHRYYPPRFINGHNDSFSGKKHSEKTKEKIRGKAIERFSNPEYKQRWVGENNPFYGKEHTEEYKTERKRLYKQRFKENKLKGLIVKGEHRNKDTEFKIGQISGSNHHNWKGGITPSIIKQRHSVHYKNWRNGVFERDDYICHRCSTRGGDLEAHHIQSFSKYPLLRYDLNNGVTCCVPCHKEIDSHRR